MLHVHRSTDADALLAGLADVLRDPAPLGDPFAPDLVAVGAPGTERWVAQRLSHHLGATGGDDGICARVDVTSPAELLDGAVAQVLAARRPDAADAVQRWAPRTLVWDVLEVLEALVPADGRPGEAGGAEFAVLRHHLRRPAGEEAPRVRRTAVASRLAGSFARYGASRPELLAAWAAGGDGGLVPGRDDDLRWQPEVFRRVRERVGLPAPAELLAEVCAALRADPALLALPPRLAVVAVTRLAASRLRVLAALADAREVHLLLHHPSPALWAATAAQLDGPDRGSARAAWQDAAVLPAHPLLRSLGRDVRELQVRLAEAAPTARDHPVPPAPPRRPGTLLDRLQRSLAEDAPAGSTGPADDTVQVHSCHGRARQVEVLREVVLGLLAADPSLQPRDVVVLCPDVEVVAPLVQAAFAPPAAGTTGHPGGGLRVVLADRPALATNPLLALAARLLDLAQGRVTATDVLDLAGTEAVRRRFHLDDEDLEQVREWTVAAGVHWGLGPEHRAAWRLGSLAQGSWRAGLDRLLTGVALDGAAGVLGGAGGEGVVPLDDVDSSRVELAGRLAELLDRLDAALARLTGTRGVAAWCEALLEGVLDLADTPPDATWWTSRLRADLGRTAADAARAGNAAVGPADVAQLLADSALGRSRTAGFRTGALTVCALTPMRSVPHRVVVLLGMDDGAFPRSTAPDADDVLARDPRVGDRDPRSEDRQVLLDAVVSARQHLVVLHGGNDVRTGADLPPAVPVGELLDALHPLVEGGTRRGFVVRHPLQPTDPANFAPGRLRPGRPFSHDATAHAGALAARGGTAPRPAFLPAALPPPPTALDGAAGDDLDLDLLVRFLQHPARGFLRQRLDVAGSAQDAGPVDALPVQLDGLQEWAVGDRALTARLGGAPAAAVARLETARGDLPPGVLGREVLRRVGGRVDEIAVVAAEFDTAPARSVDVELDLDVPGAGPTRLTGVVRGVRPVRGGGLATGDVALTTTYSRVRAARTLRAWVELLALTAARPDRPVRACVVGRAGRGGVSVLTLGPLDPAAARGHLVDLLALRRAGLSLPLPLPAETAAAWAERAWRGGSDTACAEKARAEWTSGYAFEREDRDEEHVTVWDGVVPFDRLRSWRPPPGAPPGTPASFAEAARLVWEPLLGVRRTETR